MLSDDLDRLRSRLCECVNRGNDIAEPSVVPIFTVREEESFKPLLMSQGPDLAPDLLPALLLTASSCTLGK